MVQKSRRKTTKERVWCAGYLRGINDLSLVVAEVVSTQQLIEILERFERLHRDRVVIERGD